MPPPRSLRARRLHWAWTTLMLCASPAGAWANDAEILNLQGLGDRRAATRLA